MKKLLSLPLLFAGLPVLAQDADYELVTTAMHAVRSETALPVTVLAGEELHRASRATIGETLANQPGISNASFGPAVGQTIIRGQGGRRVMNLSNGVANADASGNSADHSVTVEPLLADAIEVLRGPSTLLYGGGAIGGVINVIDNRIPRTQAGEPFFSVEARHDNASDQDAHIGRLEFDTGKFTWHVDGMRREWNNLDIPGFAIDNLYLEEDSDNTFDYIGNTGGKTQAYTIGTSYIFDKGFFGIAISELDNFYGLPSGAHGHEEHEEHKEHEDDPLNDIHEDEIPVFIDLARTRVDITGEWRRPTAWLEHVDYRFALTDYQHAEMEGSATGTQFSNDAWQQRLQLGLSEMQGWHGVLGVQASSEEFAAVGEESFIPVTDIKSQGMFLIEDFHGQAFTLELGARVNADDYSPETGSAPSRDFTTFSYSGSVLLDITPSASLGLIYSHAQRAPSVEELYSNHGLLDLEDCVIHNATGACELGSTNFRKESSNNLDLTLSLEQENYSASITLFHNDFSDYIAQVNSGSDVHGLPVREYRQLDARFTGLEADITFLLGDFTSLRIFGDTIRGRLADHGAVPRMPPKRLGSQLTYTGNQWTTYLSVVHASAQEEPGNFELATDSYTRWDAGLEYTLQLDAGELLLFSRLHNLGNDDIRLSTSYLRGYAPEAGRSLEVGLRYTY